MNVIQAAILGVVEGLTEFLPISSTGHLILVGHWLGVDQGRAKEQADAFEVVIQAGALLAVLVHYRTLLWERTRSFLRGEREGRSLFTALAIAFVPAAVLGFGLRKIIERRLFSPFTVALALIVGGVVMMAVEFFRKRRDDEGVAKIDEITPRRALLIGLGQCASLWPGTSRSMSTIVAGQLTGVSTATAAEFSFLLAVPTLGAVTMLKLVKNRHELLDTPGGAVTLGVGLLVSFLVAWAVIATFLRYLRRAGLIPFGVYRVILGIAALFLLRG